jgi:starch synthase
VSPDTIPDRIAARLGFDNVLAHRIEAGADMFLMPSLYEPCGLNQMFSQKYGTIPIVRAIGGLKDTVLDYDQYRRSGTGFVFHPYEPQALLETIDRALHVFANRRTWAALRRRAMSMDFSWDRSAQEYGRIYEQLLV